MSPLTIEGDEATSSGDRSWSGENGSEEDVGGLQDCTMVRGCACNYSEIGEALACSLNVVLTSTQPQNLCLFVLVQSRRG